MACDLKLINQRMRQGGVGHCIDNDSQLAKTIGTILLNPKTVTIEQQLLANVILFLNLIKNKVICIYIRIICKDRLSLLKPG